MSRRPIDAAEESPRAKLIRRSTRALALLLTFGVAPIFYFEALRAYGDSFGFDLRYAYLPAAEDVLAGRSPYPALTDAELYQEHAYVYPPVLAYALVPLTALSPGAAAIVGALAFFGMLFGMLRMLGVTDWRCYAAILYWTPTFNAIQNLNVSLPLAFGVACAWRFRDRLRPFALSLGVVLSLKLFVWPLLFWPAARGRLRSSVASAVVAAALILVSWAALDFQGLVEYRALVDRLAELEQLDSYSAIAVFSTLGAPLGLAKVLALVVVAVALFACVTFARRGDDRRALAAAIGAALAFSPIVWQHYLLLLVVPLAISRPRLSAAWLLPLVLWLASQDGNGAPWQTLLVPTVAVLMLGVSLRGTNETRRLRLQPA